MTNEDVAKEMYEHLKLTMSPQLKLKDGQPSPEMLIQLQRAAVGEGDALNKQLKDTNEKINMLTNDMPPCKIDNKTQCDKCHMSRGGGPPAGLDTSRAAYTPSKSTTHSLWCPRECKNLRFCQRKHG